MSFEAEVTRAITRALGGAGSVVDFADAQTGDVHIGYVAGKDVIVNLALNILIGASDGVQVNRTTKKVRNPLHFPCNRDLRFSFSERVYVTPRIDTDGRRSRLFRSPASNA